MPMSFGDKQREAWARWVGKPPGLCPELASKFMLRLHAGKTIRDLTTANTDEYICSAERLRVHCAANPEWSAEARKVSTVNSGRKKSLNQPRAMATQVMCLKGMHPMSGDNVAFRAERGWRYCRECSRIAIRNVRLDVIKPVADKIASSLQRGQRLNATLKRFGVGVKAYTRLRLIDANFDSTVRAALQNTTARSQVRQTQIQIATARQQTNDYHAIRSLIPENNPHRGDIVARIFEDLLLRSLKREDVPARVKVYIAEMNKLFPTKYRKFGDALLYSLDAPVYEDGSATQHDMVSEGLWS